MHIQSPTALYFVLFSMLCAACYVVLDNAIVVCICFVVGFNIVYKWLLLIC